MHLTNDGGQEPVHKLAWTLDACLKDRVLDDRRLRELSHFMSVFDRQSAAHTTAGALLNAYAHRLPTDDGVILRGGMLWQFKDEQTAILASFDVRLRW
jgi:hypothetical protein